MTLIILLLGTVGCNPRPLIFQPRPMREWGPALQAAKEAARSGRYAEADSILARFAARNPGSYEARQAAFWRALFLVDPANTQASSAEAIRALNQYFAERATDSTYDEAVILRRLVQETDSLTRRLAEARRLIAEAEEAAAEAAPPAAQPAPREGRANRNLVEEVRRLRDELSRANRELANANQELDRVRRRLSGQRP